MEKINISMDSKIVKIVIEQLTEKIQQLEDENTYLRIELDDVRTNNVNLNSVNNDLRIRIEELKKAEDVTEDDIPWLRGECEDE